MRELKTERYAIVSEMEPCSGVDVVFDAHYKTREFAEESIKRHIEMEAIDLKLNSDNLMHLTGSDKNDPFIEKFRLKLIESADRLAYYKRAHVEKVIVTINVCEE